MEEEKNKTDMYGNPYFKLSDGKTFSKETKFTGYCTSDVLNCRLGPGTEYKLVSSKKTIKKNDTVYICDGIMNKSGSLWYYVKIRNIFKYTYAFVSAKYIKAK